MVSENCCIFVLETQRLPKLCYWKKNNTMAKKTKDMTVEEKLKALYQLQTTLSAIDEKKALRGELPL